MKKTKSTIHQLIIIGAGPAGLSAGIYAERYRTEFIILGQIKGGTVHEGHLIDNYLGFRSITGPELANKFCKHIDNQILAEQANSLCQEETEEGKIFIIKTDQHEYQARTVILAMGMKMRKLGILNEEKFLNKGISYYAPPEIDAYQDKRVAIVGGGDSALSTALKAAQYAQKVYLIHRRDEFRGAPSLVQKAQEQQNIELCLSRQVGEVQGKEKIEKIILDDKRELEIDQLFLQVGGVPNVYLCQNLGITVENNFIQVDKNQATNVEGVFAAGDITNNPLKQIITAAAEGAVAATTAYKYLKLTENVNS